MLRRTASDIKSWWGNFSLNRVIPGLQFPAGDAAGNYGEIRLFKLSEIQVYQLTGIA